MTHGQVQFFIWQTMWLSCVTQMTYQFVIPPRAGWDFLFDWWLASATFAAIISVTLWLLWKEK